MENVIKKKEVMGKLKNLLFREKKTIMEKLADFIFLPFT